MSSLFSLAGISAVITSVYLISLAVYRLYLCPVAKFPGPRLAALTLWYEFYYDVILGGQYVFKIEQLHEQYGTTTSHHSLPPTDLQVPSSESTPTNSTSNTPPSTTHCTAGPAKNATNGPGQQTCSATAAPASGPSRTSCTASAETRSTRSSQSKPSTAWSR